MAKQYNPHTVKEGSVMEGLFAMYCAAVLIDPDNGENKREVTRFINSLAVNTQLKNMATKETEGPRKGQYKQAVKYQKTFPNVLGHSRVFNTSIVNGREALVKYPLLSPDTVKRLNASKSVKYFDTVGVDGYPDFSQVHLKVVLKEKEVGTQYGRELQMLLDNAPGPREKKQGDNYESIKKRVDALINAKGGTFFRKLLAAKRKFLKNEQSDVILWQVDADGVGGEVSGGDVKQDITIRVFANGKRVFDDTINFSLKASSATIHSGGLDKGIDLLLNEMDIGIPQNVKRELQTMFDNVKNGTEDSTGLVGFIDVAFRRILETANPPTPTKASSDKWWGLLKGRLFGKDDAYHGYIQLLELNHDSVKRGQTVSGVLEITPDWIQHLQDTGMLLEARIERGDTESLGSPGDIRIMPVYLGTKKENDIKRSLYKLRINYTGKKDKLTGRRGDPEPFKFMTDIGGKGSPIWETNRTATYFTKGNTYLLG